MRILIASLALALASFGAAEASTSLSVQATTNIFKASATGGGDGIVPTAVGFSPAAGLVLTFSSITGLTDCCSGTPDMNADGTTGLVFSGNSSVTSSGGISGLTALGRQLFLAGLFVDSSTPPSGMAPTELSYGGAGLSYELSSYSPSLNQTFFIGDGLTGTGSGTVQSFVAPAGADTLYLGFVDAGGFNGGPNFYNDNRGQLDVTFTLAAPSAAIPLPAALPLSLAALGGLGLLGTRSRRKG